MTTDKTIVIADDDRDLLEITSRRCRSLGLNVETASDAMSALQMIDQRQPDLVILDVNMPAGNGLGVLEMMADNERLSDIPVIILTGKADEETIRRCYRSCAYYVPKCSNTWSRLEPLIREVLELDVPSAV